MMGEQEPYRMNLANCDLETDELFAFWLMLRHDNGDFIFLKELAKQFNEEIGKVVTTKEVGKMLRNMGYREALLRHSEGMGARLFSSNFIRRSWRYGFRNNTGGILEIYRELAKELIEKQQNRTSAK